MMKQSPEPITDSLTDYLNKIGTYPLLNKEEEQETVRKAQAGDDEAFQKMLLSNLRLVVSIAKKFRSTGVPLSDLIQEGNLFLMDAIRKFDPDRGYRFSTYATRVITQNLGRRYEDLTRTIHVPVNKRESLKKLAKVQKALQQKLEREPTAEELAEESKMDLDTVRDLLSLPAVVTALDETLRDEADSAKLGDIIGSSDPMDDPMYKHAQNDSSHEIEKALRTLSAREEDILRLLSGYGCEKMTEEQAADHFHLSRERLKMYKERAAKKVRKILEGR